jgi:hypothetical protein
LNRFLRGALLVWPVLCLLAAAFVLPIAVPEIVDFQTFVSEDLEGIPIFLWSVLGLVLGVALSSIRARWPRRTIRYGARVLIGLGAWLLFGLVLALFMGEGTYYERLRGSVVTGSWAITAWVLICALPAMLGVHSILYRSVMARGATVLAFLFLALSGMVYSQASEVRVSHQDPYLSLAFILALVGYLEGLSWKQRYAMTDMDPSIGKLLLARQVGFTLMFAGVGAFVALVPFIVGDIPEGYYEPTTVLGKAFRGLVALSPLAILALTRHLLDR